MLKDRRQSIDAVRVGARQIRVPVAIPPGIPNEVARQIYATGKVYDLDDREHEVWAHITQLHWRALYGEVLRRNPQLVVEVGMSCGLSTLAILTALEELGGLGKLISIDPYQSTERKSIGIASVRRAGLVQRHTLMEEPDFAALPKLLSAKTTIDFAYVDGWHTFDYVLLDFFYIDKMMNPGGVIGFNDCGWKAVHRALRFITTHRKYRETDVGLSRDFRGRNFAVTSLRRLLDFSWEDRYFMKAENWEPHSHFYAPDFRFSLL